MALYVLNENEYPDDDDLRKEIPKTKKIPALSTKKIIDLLGNLKFRKYSIWGSIERRVFYKDELNNIAPIISETLTMIKPHQRLVIITRYDPDKSVLSRMERVTALLFADKFGLNLVLGEIRYEIPHNDFLVYSDWTEILPIDMSKSYPYYTLIPSSDFELKKIKGSIHRTWAVFKLDDLGKVNYKPDRRKFNHNEKINIIKRAHDEKLLTDKEYKKKMRDEREKRKLKVLKEALDAGIITQQEYKEKLKKLKEPEEKKEPDKSKETKT